MNTSKLIGKILLTFFTVTIVFVGYLYYLGTSAQVPLEETLVDGQWVKYQDTSAGYPGDVYLSGQYEFTGGSYVNPVIITGEARSAWFYKGTAYAELLAADGSVLWEGFVEADEKYIYDMDVPFSAEIDIGNYAGEATFIMYHTDESTIVNETDAPYSHSYSAGIIIADVNDYEEIEEDVN